MTASSHHPRDTYEVMAKLAEGGMGAIYQVRHRHLDQVRVIKVMRPQLGGDADFEARFLREARIEARLHHPNIAQLHEFEVASSGVAYMVMEFIDGVSLKEALRHCGPLSPGLVLEVARQALEALGYLHAEGVVHRDISPDNLMFGRAADGAPRVKLIDLGIAKKVQEPAEARITVTGTFLGKVCYASPEQFGTDGVDARSDLYSLGIVLYELLTGALPIRGTDTSSWIAGHLMHLPRPFEETDPEGRVPEALREIILRALEKEPEERFASSEAFAAALAPLQEVHPWSPAEVEAVLRGAHQEPTPLAPGFTLDLGQATSPAGREELPTVIEPEEGSRRDHRGIRAPGTHGWKPRRAVAAAALTALALVAGLVTVERWVREKPLVPAEERELSGQELQDREAALVAGLGLGDYHALVVGNGAYAHLPRLETAVRDAEAVADLLEEGYGFEVRRLLDATREQMFGAVSALKAEVGPRDHVLVYYAGHGARLGESLYWQPVDADGADTTGWLAVHELDAELEELQARHVLVVADSCYSGVMGEGGGVVEIPASLAEAARRRARLALASGGLQPVADRAPGGEHSIFANALLDLLRDNRRVLGSTALFEGLALRVEERALLLELEQRPAFAALPRLGHDGGDFLFVPVALLGGAS